ncbi:MAG: beta-1,3-glucanase family protein [Roseiarcus sp.]
MTERIFAAIIVGGLFTATPASADLLMNFQDERDDAAAFYIAFGVNTTAGDVFTATGTVGGVAGVTLNPNQSYLYSENPSNCLGADTLCGAVDITKASPNARVLVSLGNGLTIANDGSANFANPDPGNAAQLLDFQTRWDKFEFAYGATGGANLTSTDFFGLPMKLTTTQASHPSQTLTWNYSSTVKYGHSHFDTRGSRRAIRSTRRQTTGRPTSAPSWPMATTASRSRSRTAARFQGSCASSREARPMAARLRSRALLHT